METLNIDKFNPKKSELIQLADSCKNLIIKGVDDKEGYELVNRKRIELKNARVEITKTGKTLRAEALNFQRAVIEKEKEFVAIIEPLEIELESKQKAVDMEKEKIKRMELLPDRKEKLLKINIRISDDDLLIMNDLEFHTFLNDETSKYLEEKERVMEEKRIREENEKAEIERQIKLKKEAEAKEKQRLLELEEAKERATKLAILKAEKEKQDAIEEEKRKAAEREKAIREEHEAKEKARIQKEVEDRIAKEKKDEEERLAREKKEAEEKAEQERIDKDKKWKDFLKKSGWTKEKENDFYILQNGNIRIIYKKVGEITI